MIYSKNFLGPQVIITNLMKFTRLFGIIITSILVVSVILTLFHVFSQVEKENSKKEFFFGVSYGQNSFEEAKNIIDKVKNYTNLFIINSYPLTTNNTNPNELNKICDYAAKSNLYFIVYFFSFKIPEVGTWQQNWIDLARQNWGKKFLGVYLRDEPGGYQIENGTFISGSTYAEASENFVVAHSSSFSMKFLKEKNVTVFTSDFGLYYYDYLAGYDTVFAEFGWNNSRIRQIGLCRGAANILNKDWGAIITWTYMHPPFIGSGEEIYEDMLTAYRSGAKYLVIFDYSKEPIDGKYGILTDEHFEAMEQFWNYVNSSSNDLSKIQGKVAYLLPNNYGWAMRYPNDTIWGIWNADEKSVTIWDNLIWLENKYGSELDIIYDDPRIDFKNGYQFVYSWNSTLN